jgi:putative ABC transport system permease protein
MRPQPGCRRRGGVSGDAGLGADEILLYIPGMFHNYLKTAFRNLLRGKMSTIINILGLGLGLAAFIGISIYVRYERSYDRMLIPAGQTIYRVESQFYKSGQLTDDWATSTNGYALALKKHFPEVADFTRVDWSSSERVVRRGNIRFRETHVCFADSNFFSFFPYVWLRGDKVKALREVNSIVISASAAKKYFGNADPIGQQLEVIMVSKSYPCTVTGVFDDPPANSTMQFSMLLSWAMQAPWKQKTWYVHESYTFLKLAPGTSPALVEAGFPAVAEGYKDGPAMKDSKWAIKLVPLQDIHLQPVKPNEIEVKGSRRAVGFLGVLAYVILLIACINYINLSTARALHRAKEVGMRKVSGARPWQLMGQFLLESLLLGLPALALGVLLAVLANVFLLRWLGSDRDYGAMADAAFWGRIGSVYLAAVVLSGLYPAFVLTRFRPITVLKGRYSFSRGGVLLRKGLVTFQMVLSFLLIAGTLAVYRQLLYMRSQDAGVRVEQTLVIKAPMSATGYAEKTAALKNRLRGLSGVSGVTLSGAVPGREVGEFLANRRFGADKSEERLYEMLKVDEDFLPIYKPELIAGRGFDPTRPADSTGLVLNESAVRSLGLGSPESALGQQVWLEANPGRTDKVIGVIRDYHQQGLQQAYTPLILFMDPAYPWVPVQYYSLKLDTRDMARMVDGVQRVWTDIFPESSFDYFFLDEFYDRQYQDDRQFARVTTLFSGLAIFIGLIGLLGLTAHASARRTREVGIRKVLGATAAGIMGLLSIELIQLLVLASLLALPLSWWIIHQWLQGYAFRQALSWWVLLAPLPFLLVITFATTSWLSWRAARVNPVDSLKEE